MKEDTGRRRNDSMIFPKMVMRILFAGFISCWLLVSFWLCWPYQPMVFHAPIKILNSGHKVEPGGQLVYEANITKRLAVEAIVSRQLINNFVITYSPLVSNIPIGKRIMKIKLGIPQSAEPGEYKLKWEGHYQVNPLREIVVIAWSDPFEVIDPLKTGIRNGGQW